MLGPPWPGFLWTGGSAVGEWIFCFLFAFTVQAGKGNEGERNAGGMKSCRRAVVHTWLEAGYHLSLTTA